MSPEMNNFIKFLARLAVEDYLREINYRGTVNEICQPSANNFETETLRNRSKTQSNPSIIEAQNEGDQ